MGLGVTTLLVASSLIAGQASPAVSTETTFMNQTIDENKTYTEEDFPVNYELKPCSDKSHPHNCSGNDYLSCQSSLRAIPSQPWGSLNPISLTPNGPVIAKYHARVPEGYAWLDYVGKEDQRRQASVCHLSNYDSNLYDFEQNYVDSDCEYYSFELYQTTSVTLNVSASSDAIICHVLKVSYSAGNDYSGTLQNYHECLFNQAEKVSDTVFFSQELEPGSYLVGLERSKTDSQSNDVEKVGYSLDLFLESEANSEYSIADLRYNKNLSGAIWSSSYRPFGEEFSPKFNEANSIRNLGKDVYYYKDYYEGQKEPNNHFDYALDYIMEKANDGIIPSDIVYLWDKDVIGQVHDYLINIGNSIQNRYNSASAFNEAYTYWYSLIAEYLGFKIEVACAFVPADPVGSIVLSYASAAILDAILNPLSLGKEGTTWSGFDFTDVGVGNLKNYGTFIFNLANATNTDVLSDTAVVQLPIGYRLYKDEGMWCSATHDMRHLYQGISVFQNYTANNLNNYGWNCIYNGKSLYSNPYTAYLLPGTFKGLKRTDSGTTIDDIDSFANEYKPVETIDAMDSSRNICVSSVSLSSNVEGDYQWFKYTATENAPHAFIAVSGTSLTTGRPITMELFNKQVLGYSGSGCFAKVDATSVKNGRYGAFYDLYLKKGVTVWIRIKGLANFSSVNSGMVTVAYESSNGIPLTNQINYVTLKHIHTYGYRYGDATDEDLKDLPCDSNGNVISCHRSYCWKDDCYILECHTYSVSYSFKDRLYLPRCSKCGYLKPLTYKWR